MKMKMGEIPGLTLVFLLVGGMIVLILLGCAAWAHSIWGLVGVAAGLCLGAMILVLALLIYLVVFEGVLGSY